MLVSAIKVATISTVNGHYSHRQSSPSGGEQNTVNHHKRVTMAWRFLCTPPSYVFSIYCL